MYRSLTIAALLLTGLLCEACSQQTLYQPPPVDGSACPAAEARLRELDCKRPDGWPWYLTRSGQGFAAACEAAARDGRVWRADCLARIGGCSDVGTAYAVPAGSACP
jgi:hypothetical protein